MKTNIFLYQLGRNAKALLKRFIRSVKRGDDNSIIRLLVIALTEGAWLTCLLSSPVVFLLGFWKAHCFILGIALYFVAALIRSNNDEEREFERDGNTI